MSKKKLTPEEYKQVAKELLAYIDKLCRDNNIHYYVGYGALIGVIRHNGFIPWDDDIDIAIPRDDYEKFLQLFPRENGRYYTLTSKNTDSYYDNFSRVCDRRCILKIHGCEDIENFGAFVDVMPLDVVPEDKAEREAFYKELLDKFHELRYYGLPWRCYRTLSLKQKVKRALNIKEFIRVRRKSTDTLRKERDAIMTRYRDTESPYLANLFDLPGDYLLVNKDDIQELERHQFEDITINIPKNYDKILRTQYGNYMQLPPDEKRITLHHFTPYWRD